MVKRGVSAKAADEGRLGKVTGPLLIRRFSVRQPEMYRVVETVSAKKLTAIDEAALCELAQTVMDIEFDGLDGDLLQAGCGMGGAAIVVAHAKRRNRAFTIYDLFNAGTNTETQMRRELAAHGVDERLNVKLVSGPFESITVEGPIAFAHLDTWRYEPMRILLEKFAPRLVKGGHLIIDDYKKDECRKAVDEYFRGRAGFELVRKSRLHVIKS
jgi:asparagine synthase (glutamine-hydrolysing)